MPVEGHVDVLCAWHEVCTPQQVDGEGEFFALVDLKLEKHALVFVELAVDAPAFAHNIFGIVVEGGHVCGGVGEEEEEDPHVEG